MMSGTGSARSCRIQTESLTPISVLTALHWDSGFVSTRSPTTTSRYRGWFLLLKNVRVAREVKTLARVPPTPNALVRSQEQLGSPGPTVTMTVALLSLGERWLNKIVSLGPKMAQAVIMSCHFPITADNIYFN